MEFNLLFYVIGIVGKYGWAAGVQGYIDIAVVKGIVYIQFG